MYEKTIIEKNKLQENLKSIIKRLEYDNTLLFKKQTSIMEKSHKKLKQLDSLK